MLTVNCQDITPGLVAVWELGFASEPFVTIYSGNIVDDAAEDAVGAHIP